MITGRFLDYPAIRYRSVFNDLDKMRHEIDRLFERIPGREFPRVSAGVYPLINLRESKDKYFIRAELPGLKTEELSISATGNNLSIAGERKITSEGEHVKYHRREREAGSFSRIIALPGEINIDMVEASLINGILTVIVPKAEAAKPKQISVKQE